MASKKGLSMENEIYKLYLDFGDKLGQLKLQDNFYMMEKKHKNTTISVKYDCGYNNHLTLRGEGAGLSWSHGTPLKNIAPGEWIFEVAAPDKQFEFKILINDQIFELGENHRIEQGQRLELRPKFHP
jgi:hypothetical protein